MGRDRATKAVLKDQTVLKLFYRGGPGGSPREQRNVLGPLLSPSGTLWVPVGYLLAFSILTFSDSFLDLQEDCDEPFKSYRATDDVNHYHTQYTAIVGALACCARVRQAEPLRSLRSTDY